MQFERFFTSFELANDICEVSSGDRGAERFNDGFGIGLATPVMEDELVVLLRSALVGCKGTIGRERFIGYFSMIGKKNSTG